MICLSAGSVTRASDDLEYTVGLLEARISALEEELSAVPKSLLSKKKATFVIGGELEMEYVDAGADGADPNGRFQLDRFVLKPEITMGDQVKFKAEFNFEDRKAYVDEFHTIFYDIGLFTAGSWLNIGQYERWPKGHFGSPLEGYSLPGTAFFRDDALTVTLGGAVGSLDCMLSVGSGYEINNKQVSEDGAAASKIIHDNHASAGIYDSMEIGVNVGGQTGAVDWQAFYYSDELSDADVGQLQGYLNNYASADDGKQRVGFTATTTVGAVDVRVLYVEAEDGDLQREGYAIELSRKLKLGGDKYFTHVTPLIGYSVLDVDDRYDADPAKPESWDREMTVLGLIFDFAENTKLKLEYYLNDEETGDAGEVDNDELLAQLEMKF